MAEEYGAVDLSAFQKNPTSESPGSTAPLSASSPAASEDFVPGPIIREADDQNFDEVMKLSVQVPVLVDLWAQWCEPCKQLGPVLEELATEYAGQFCLVKVEVDHAPGLAQAFGAQSIPMVVAIVGGRPVPLFQGAQPKAQIKPLIDQLLQVAAQAGVTKRLAPGNAQETTPALSPEETEIYALVEAGQLPEAIALAEKTLRNNPQEKTKYQALVDQLKLQHRLESETVNSADQNDPFFLADQFFAQGNHPQAFQILLAKVAETSGEEREPYRERLLELFRISEQSEAVKAARGQLARLLF